MPFTEKSLYIKTMTEIYDLMDHLLLAPAEGGYCLSDEYYNRQLKRLNDYKNRLRFLVHTAKSNYNQKWEMPIIIVDKEGNA